ncbi:ribonuclease P protein component [Mycoplasmopsis synoviae]|uniref:Ribonuclease P protein component n=3 Tax=Mycoplasmopsis synoviae TaxID=2109 RepID=RNPA_MYCS5|nr:ribonuclease P protein component [Mycoplasmopsis synoviae]Q4A5G4.1 RecName: Full=Ribonuclease P protein component; Short=RNase P protein; Short=RNaseP protein; AltName: Full=Protein C5 [Mycoplasmopsis synoviae 53]AAZ44007.1 ribonuclease P protein component [Mycoplasmopsis synoviae 53]AKJ20823.1 Ribonuclease P protein component [Mycoplasmopsis synoviae]AQU48148.1 Ribonuclease P protein component [Mycoplasmopsis synoviae]AWL84365.1 ribonuclease P protein component [Mycoplasmopsis synoviae]QG
MKKQYRLRKNWEFDLVLKNKKFIANKYVIVYYKKASAFKVGITVPKKFANSVGRNYHKRQMKAIVHKMNLYNYPYEMVIIIRKNFINCNFLTKVIEIEKIFTQFKQQNEKIK